MGKIIEILEDQLSRDKSSWKKIFEDNVPMKQEQLAYFEGKIDAIGYVIEFLKCVEGKK